MFGPRSNTFPNLCGSRSFLSVRITSSSLVEDLNIRGDTRLCRASLSSDTESFIYSATGVLVFVAGRRCRLVFSIIRVGILINVRGCIQVDPILFLCDCLIIECTVAGRVVSERRFFNGSRSLDTDHINSSSLSLLMGFLVI